MIPYIKYTFECASMDFSCTAPPSWSGISTEISELINTLADFLENRRWRKLEDESFVAYGIISFPGGAPYYTDPNGIIYHGDVVFANGGTIHLMTPKQLSEAGDPPSGTIYVEAGTSSEASLSIIAGKIQELNAAFSGVPIENGVMVVANEAGPDYNNAEFSGNGTWSIGCTTKNGGWMLQSATYRISSLKLKLIDDSGGKLRLTFFIGPTHKYAVEYITAWRSAYRLIATEYEFILFVNNRADEIWLPGDQEMTHSAIYAGCPYVEQELQLSILDFSLIIYNTDETPGNTVRNRFNRNKNFAICVNNTFRNGVQYEGYDTGIIIPCDRFNGIDSDELMSIGPNGLQPIIQPAFIAIPTDIRDPRSETRIVGRFWNSFIASKYYDWGTPIHLDGYDFIHIASQKSSGWTDPVPACSMFTKY